MDGDVFETVRRFYERYRKEKAIAGYSALGLPVYAFFVGRQEYPVLLFQYAIHAREWITAYLALRHIERGIGRGGAWFLPLTNPDGAALSLRGEGFLSEISSERAAFLRRVNGGKDFSLWKANANAVDLNVNFGAFWGTGKHNVRMPAPENYIGSRPFSEPETRALRDFTLRVKPHATVSYHTKGEEIYYGFHAAPASEKEGILARALSDETGYAARVIEESAGGYKDWCSLALKIPAFTIEAGSDTLPHPLKESDLCGITEKNIGVPRRLAEELWKTK